MQHSDKNFDSNRKDKRSLRRLLRQNATSAEAALWCILKGKQIDGLQWRRQFSVGPYVLDFYCPRIRLCIELDGEYHYASEGFDHDNVRTEWLWREKRIYVVRLENRDVFTHHDRIVSLIRNIVKEIQAGNTPPSILMPPSQ